LVAVAVAILRGRWGFAIKTPPPGGADYTNLQKFGMASKKQTGKKKAAAKKTKPPAARHKAAAVAAKKPAKKRARKTAAKKTAGEALIFGIRPYQPDKKEEYMNPRQREHFRAILEAWRGQLYDEVSRTVHNMQDENINHPDPSDRASQETDIALELRNRDRERKLLRKISQSMALIDSDDYGFCEKCGEEIGLRRLEARPTATLCVDCKTLDEIRERQMA